MKNFKYVVDEIYEFFDEIIGSIVPGLYFCSYPIFAVVIFLLVCSTNYDYNIPYVTLFLFSVSYVIGTMFRRSNSRDPDFRSANYIYKNSCPHDDNDYAFVKLISNEEYDKIIDDFKLLASKDRLNIHYNHEIICNRRKKLSIIKRLFYPKHEIKNRKNKAIMCSKAFVLYSIYQLLNKNKKKFQKDISKYNMIDDFIKKHNLEYYCVLYVDYPYSNLKNYLSDRGMNYLTKYIKWTEEDDSKTTARSKSVICNMKLDIKHYLPNDYSQLMKTEAHIRFMNAIWYANKLLTRLVCIILILSLIISTILFFTLDYELLSKFYNAHNGEELVYRVQSWVSIIKNIFETIFGANFETSNLMVALILLCVLSLVYLLFNAIIRNTIENNFHYQRVREIVSILHLYDLVQKEKKSPNK